MEQFDLGLQFLWLQCFICPAGLRFNHIFYILKIASVPAINTYVYIGNGCYANNCYCILVHVFINIMSFKENRKYC